MFPLDILGGKSARNWPKLISLARARRLTAVLERVAVTTPAAKREVYLIGASLKLQPACVWERGVGFLPFFFFFFDQGVVHDRTKFLIFLRKSQCHATLYLLLLGKICKESKRIVAKETI